MNTEYNRIEQNITWLKPMSAVVNYYSCQRLMQVCCTQKRLQAYQDKTDYIKLESTYFT